MTIILLYSSWGNFVMRDIENIRTSHLLLKEVKRQNEEFDIVKFYLLRKGSKCGGAVQIIMPDHQLSCFANKSHKLVVENVYGLLYKDFSKFNTEVWQEESCARGNILLQLCANGCSLAWIPKEITDFQFKRLAFSCAMIRELNFEATNNGLALPDVDMSLASPIYMETNLKGETGEMLSIDEALPKIRSRVLVKSKVKTP